MTDQELRVRVAELCGWRYGPCPCGACHVHERVWCRDGKPPYYNSIDMLPDYPHDLNAMHGAVSTLTDKQYDRFCDILWNDCHGASGKAGAINATARQRAEAFVKTMEEKT